MTGPPKLPVALQSARKRPVRRALLYFWALALGLAACRSAPITIRAGLLLDGRGGQMRDAQLTVEDGKLAAVAPWHGDTVTYDLSRYTVLPGLIDAHVHITGYINRLGRVNTTGDGETPAQHAAGHAANALATLRAGFTTVASMGTGADRELSRRIDAGRIPGPRILTSLTQIRGADLSLDSLRRMVQGLHARGADFIKIIASNAVRDGGKPTLADSQLTALCGEATRLKLRSVVHAHDDASLRQAALSGCTEVEHGFMATAAGLEVLAQHGVYFDPQCGLLLRNYLDNQARYQGIEHFDSAEFVMLRGLLPRLTEVTRTALGIPGLKLLYGTDATAGAHGRNAEDLICRVREAGQSPMEALVTATSRNAIALGLGDRIGAIAPGYEADLIALDGDPLQEIEALRRVRFVMKGGRVLETQPAALPLGRP